MKKLLICGDSFAADWTVKYDGVGWPNMLAKEYEVTNLAQAGCGEYKIYKQLLSVDLASYDFIVVSHTSPNRIYIGQHPVHFEDILHKDSDLIYADLKEHSKVHKGLEPITKYFEQYFDFEYAKFVHGLICEKIDRMTSQFKTLHIDPMWELEYKFRNKICFTGLFDKYRGVMNHFNDEGNAIVFSEVQKSLTKI